MTTIKLDDKDYEVENLSDQAKKNVAALQFANIRIHELTNMSALLQCAKNSYIETLKREMLSNKTGFPFDND